MSYKASFSPNVVVTFHMWTTSGPKQLHTEFGQNTHTTSIPAGPLSFMNESGSAGIEVMRVRTLFDRSSTGENCVISIFFPIEWRRAVGGGGG